ncbi:SseB family protein [Saccharothrix algeriensis]|uniref:SseB family protein n=1 Tax=Saccharothrix algeriensis TaxID=173560 RepID=A0A8T8I4Y5_9PSEU|nr:SseB family protein [Saccharothrix algeriensis]MBM7811992.1 hypothetical protein [Saccharothrix algeriensis]QTR05691.1 SseB family protein [Saccharothrix algeriensis]
MPVPIEYRLHKAVGVRGLDLARVKATELGRRLHVRPEDDEWVVLAKVVWQVENAIRLVTNDEKNREILRYAYNTPRDSELNTRWLGDRLELLAGRKGRGWAAFTTNKVVGRLTASVGGYLRLTVPAPHAGELAELVEAERDYSRTGIGRARVEVDGSHLSNLIDAWNTSRRDEIEYWLERWTLHFEVEDGFLATTRTPGGGEFLCVFTSAERLAEYQRSTGRPGCSPARDEGGRVLDLVARTPGVGLVVDPVVGGTGSTYWTAEEVARRWSVEG